MKGVSFVDSLRVQRRIIGALLMREVITRFGRENIGVLWLVGEPMLFTLGIVALWSAAGMSHSDAVPVAAFAITGYSSVLLWRNTVNRCNMAIQQNLPLLYHRNVRLFDVLAARILLELAGTTLSFTALLIIFGGIEWISWPSDMGAVLVGWLMLAWFGAALGLVIGSATAYSDVVERLWHPAAYLLFPLSGAAYMVDWFPPPAREVILLLPMVHGVEVLREGFFGGVVKTHYDLGYMATVNLCLSLAGLWLLRDAALRVEQK
jgi:capsular polysaccharide transport system permease protein